MAKNKLIFKIKQQKKGISNYLSYQGKTQWVSYQGREP